MSLQELAKKELELFRAVDSIKGTIEQKDYQIGNLSIYDEYKRIHQEYAIKCDEDVEALKRGLFLMWYSMAEPSSFTGIKELDLEAELKVVQALERRIKSNSTDYELDWMLGYYSN